MTEKNMYNNALPPKSDLSHVNQGEFISFLNSEIDTLRTEIQRPGWTTWAIIGGLAVLIWLLLQEIELGRYTIRNATGLLLLIFLAQYFCMVIQSLIGSSTSMFSVKGRFVPYYRLTSNRVIIILLIGQQVFLGWVAYNFSKDVGSWASIFSYLIFAVILFLLLVILILSFVKVPIPTSSNISKLGKLMSITIAILFAILIWRYISVIVTSDTFSIFDVRFAFLIAAIFYLVFMLVRVPRHALTLETLSDIRREFFLGRIDIDAAMRYTDIALTGLRASDVLEEHVNKLLSLYREASVKFNDFSSYMDELETISREDEGSLSDEQKTRRHSLIEALARTINEADEIISNRITKAWIPLKIRITVVLKYAAGDDTLDNLLTKVEDTHENLANQSKDVSKKFKTLRETLN